MAGPTANSAEGPSGDSSGEPQSRLARRLQAGAFVLTAEVAPPVSADPETLLAKAEPLRDLVDGINVTDGARAKVHMSSVAAAAILAGAGLEPVLQMTCRDRNRIALEADLLGAWALGVRNIMILGGDKPPTDIAPAPKAVFDMDAVELIGAAARLRDHGTLTSGAEVAAPPRFLIGGADLPIDPEPGWEPGALKAKRAAGAGFVQTQFCFDLEMVRRYAGRLGELGLLDGLALIIGIGPIASAKSARWMRENLYGTRIPDALVERLDAADDQKAEGVRLCAELIDGLAAIDGVAGAHLMSPISSATIPDAIRLSSAASG